MEIIYKPKGRALEYSLLALNPWGKSFCSHACSYCYCPSMFHMTRQQWEQQPFTPRKDLIKLLRKDCETLRGTNERVMCCFAGDLYSPEAVRTGLPRHILQTFREFDVPFQVLTKGGTRAAADFDLYGPNDAFATTLTFMSVDKSASEEPGAAEPHSRARAIYEAKSRRITTWVSLEPVIDPAETLEIIHYTHDIVDLYKIGKLNHDNARADQIDWDVFAFKAMNLCNKYEVPFIFKNDLLAYCDFAIVGACKDDPRVAHRTESLRQMPKGEGK